MAFAAHVPEVSTAFCLPVFLHLVLLELTHLLAPPPVSRVLLVSHAAALPLKLLCSVPLVHTPLAMLHLAWSALQDVLVLLWTPPLVPAVLAPTVWRGPCHARHVQPGHSVLPLTSCHYPACQVNSMLSPCALISFPSNSRSDRVT